MALNQEKKESITLILLGEMHVGKTSFIKRFDANSFDKNLITTLGVDFIEKSIQLKNEKKITLKIYDTAGQERYRTLTKSYYKKADGVILIYSINDRDSFDKINQWIMEIKEQAKEEVIIYLIGNKCDDESNRTVKKKEGEELSKKNKIAFFESSAKLDINIKNVFLEISEAIIERKVNEGENGTQLSAKKAKKKKCC